LRAGALAAAAKAIAAAANDLASGRFMPADGAVENDAEGLMTGRDEVDGGEAGRRPWMKAR